MTEEQIRSLQSELMVLAHTRCVVCLGSALRISQKGITVCNCVNRTVFRICRRRWRLIQDGWTPEEDRLEQWTVPVFGGEWRLSLRGVNYSRPDLEWAADFELLIRRELTERDQRLVRLHYFLGADWKLCCAKLRIDRGTFFHAVYRIEAKLGRAIRELQPYPLFPFEKYHGRRQQKPPRAVMAAAA